MDERTESSAPAEVVVGSDGTAPALRAVAWAATEARLRGRGLRIVHVASYADVEPGCPGCPPGRRPLLPRSDFGVGLTNGESDDGGFEEFRELMPRRRRNSAFSARSFSLSARN